MSIQKVFYEPTLFYQRTTCFSPYKENDYLIGNITYNRNLMRCSIFRIHIMGFNFVGNNLQQAA